MKLKNRKPTDPEVTARILKRIQEMTPEEVIVFLEYHTPGIEETDMTGMFGRTAKTVMKPQPSTEMRSRK